MNVFPAALGLRRRIRRWFGLGWTETDFESRYRSVSCDAWKYEHSELHAQRRERILTALADRPWKKVLELGCAEGFLTRALAARCTQLLAYDLCEEAVERTRQSCADLPNVRVKKHDIRNGFPERSCDLCVCSDVLYYLTPTEISHFVQTSATNMPAQSTLLFANEWCDNYRDLTSPEVVLQILDGQSDWNRKSLISTPLSPGARHVVAVYERGHRTERSGI